MASARILTTIELGHIRYEAAAHAERWPAEIRYRDTSAPLGRAAEVTVNGVYGVESLPFSTSLSRGARAEWSVILPVPAGPLSYSVVKSGKIVATGGIEVEPPARPLALSPHVRELRHSAPSGARVVREPGKPPVVHFTFMEEVFTVRDVFVECDAVDDPLRLSKNTGPDGDTFEGRFILPVGVHAFRFRVVLKEPARPDAAPFTNLGWDPAHSHSGGLATWEETLVVEKDGDALKSTAGTDTESPKIEEGKPATAALPNAEISTPTSVIQTESVAKESVVEKPVTAGVDVEPLVPSESTAQSVTGDVKSAQENIERTEPDVPASGKEHEEVRDVGNISGTDTSDAMDRRKIGQGRGFVGVVCVALLAVCVGIVRRARGACDEDYVFTAESKQSEENDESDDSTLSVRKDYLQYSSRGY